MSPIGSHSYLFNKRFNRTTIALVNQLEKMQKPTWMCVLCVACTFIQYCSSTSEGCQFPDFVQTIGPGMFWRGKVHNENTDPKERMTIQGNLMTIADMTNRRIEQRATRKCEEELPNNLFLVSQDDQTSYFLKYMCVQIVKRSKTVIQLRESRFGTSKDVSLCNETAMVLSDWPYVRTGLSFADREPCPLQGGYSTLIYDRRMGGVCDVHNGKTRIESTCTVDDGVYFRYRRTSCIPTSISMLTNQMTFCLAHWYQGSYTFTLLKHDFHDVVWLFRHPINPGDNFLAYLFNNLQVETNPSMPESRRDFIRFEMSRDQSFDLNNLCYNDYAVCRTKSNSCYNPTMKLTCAVTCEMCQTYAPRLSTLPSQVQGIWSDRTKVFRLPIIINDTSLEISGVEGLHSVELPWRANQTGSDLILVTVFNNGCRPRYTCMRAIRRSPSFLHIKLSKSLDWPLDTSQRICKNDVYVHHHTSQPLTLRKRYFTPLLSTTSLEAVSCNLNTFYQSFNTENRNCSVAINYTEGDSSFHVEGGYNCSSYIGNTTYRCLASWEDHRSSDRRPVGFRRGRKERTHNKANKKMVDRIIGVSVNLTDSSEQYLCWLVRLHEGRITRMTAVPFRQCHEGLKRLLRQGSITPIADLEAAPPVISTTPGAVTPQSNNTRYRTVTIVVGHDTQDLHPIYAFVNKVLVVLHLILVSLFR